MAKRSVKRFRGYLLGVILGGLASTVNHLCHLAAGVHFSVGDLFLFICAGALGFPATLASILVAGGYDWFFGVEGWHAARLALLMAGWALLSSRNSRLAGFPFVAVAWVALFIPAAQFAQHFWGLAISWERLTKVAAADVSLALLAGCALLNGTVWVWLTRRAPRWSRLNLLAHALTGAAVAATISAYAFLPSGMTAYGMPALLGVFTFSIGVPYWLAAFVGQRLGLLESDVPSSALLRSSRQAGFSGLWSSCWRHSNAAEAFGVSSTPSLDSSTRILTPSHGSSTVNSDKAICAIDNLGTITFANRRFKKLFGIVDEEIIGKKIDAVQMTPAAREAILSHLRTFLIAGPHSSEVRLNQLPDNLRFLELTSTKSEALEDSALGSDRGDLIISARDITDRRAIETHLLQAQRLASLGNFISGIGHTFNNALMKIIGKSTTAQRSTNPAVREKALQEIIDSAWQAAEQVRKLVDFAEGPPSLTKRCDISRVIEEHKILLQGMVGSRCTLQISSSGELGVSCDQNLILQAITNLVLNARDSYDESGGSIEVDLATENIPEEVSAIHIGARPGTFVRLRVQDHGVGMTADVLAHAFDPLFTTRRSRGHTGLGLSTVYAIVRAHDGFLTAVSHPQRGTTVSLYFPQVSLAEQAPAPPSISSEDQSPENHAKARILVVEDDSSIREMIIKMLGALGYEVSGCGNGVEALEHCSADHFDLLLVDLAMPEMPGSELISKLKQRDSSSRTVLMTGYGQNAVQSQATASLAKPFDMETLAHTVSSALSAESNNA